MFTNFGESVTKVVPNIKEKEGREAVAPEWERRWWLSANIENVVEKRKKKATRVFPGKQKETPTADASAKGEDDEREQSEGVLNERLES